MPEPPGHRPPRLALLMGDVAGVGPEVVARALETCRRESDPLVVGHPGVLARALDLVGLERRSTRPPISGSWSHSSTKRNSASVGFFESVR